MAGDWIKLETTTPDKPEVFIMADELDLDADAVLGKLCRVWIWADQQTLDGNAASVTRALPPALLDRIAGATGFASAMLSVGWLVSTEHGLCFPNFDRHNGQTAKSRALTAKRVARSRDAQKRKCNAESGASVTQGALQERYLEREKSKSITETASAVSCPEETSEPDDDDLDLRNQSGEIFPLAKGKTWELPADRLAQYDASYPFDVRQELAKAREWLRDRPERRPKSVRGIKQFLTGWLNRATPVAPRNGESFI